MNDETYPFSSSDDSEDNQRPFLSTRIDDSFHLDARGDPTPELETTRYVIREQIGAGGTGNVYRAEDLHLPRDVALKVLSSKYMGNHNAIQFFSEESYIIGYLTHPGVPPVHESGYCTDGRPYHVMKLIAGNTLSELVRSGDPSIPKQFSIFADICQTMAFAHDKGIVHLDLKPSNIMVGSFGNVYVMDWGLARILGQPETRISKFIASEPRKCLRAIVGTWEYMAPEQANGNEVDERADVFSLGAILCKLLIGRAPYNRFQAANADTSQMVVDCNLEAVFAELESSESDCRLVRLDRRCLSKNPLS